MLRARKEELVTEWKERFSDVAGVVLTDYRGLTVHEMGELRAAGRELGVTVKVVTNRLFKLAIAGTQWDKVADQLNGPMALVYHDEDPVAPAKVAVKYAKDSKLEIRGGLLSGEPYDEAGVEAFSKLPGKDELRSRLLAQFQAPAQSFVRHIAAAPTNFVYLLDARKRALEE